jgi:O-antigen/teichoic acid export membrane protein
MWPSMFASLAMIGLPEALAYLCARHPSESRRYLLTAGLLAFVAAPVFAAAGLMLVPHLLSTQSPRVIHAAGLYLLLVPIYALVGLPHQLLRGIQRYALWNVIRLVPPLLWLAVLTAALFLRITDPTRMTTAYLVVLGCVGPLATWIVWTHSTGPATPSVAAAGALMRFGLPSALATLPQFFNLRLDQVFVAAVLPARDLGIYMVAVAWGSCIPMFSGALAMVVSTQIAARTVDSERRRHFTRGVRGATWLIAIPVIALIGATPLAVTLVFGTAFQAAVVPAMILVIASGANALNGVLEELLRGYGRPGATLWAETTALVVGLPALLILLPREGLTGAGVASLIGYLAGTTVLLIQSRRHADLRVLEVLDPRSIRWSEVSTVTLRLLRLRFGHE